MLYIIFKGYFYILVEHYLINPGNYIPPTPHQIKAWMVEYNLNHDTFAEMLGVKSRRIYKYLLDEENKSHMDMPYMHTYLMLINLRIIKPPRRKLNKKNDFFLSFSIWLRASGISIDEFCKNQLGFKRARFYQLKNEKPEELVKNIKSRIDKKSLYLDFDIE